MNDWESEVRARLVHLRLRPEREADIVDEISQHLAERYREAVATLLRLPAPDQAAINWKRSRLRQEPYWGLCDVPHEEVEKAIADDEAFLAAHPIKKVKKADSLEPGPKPRVR